MAISFTEYDTNTIPTSVLLSNVDLATMSVAMSNFWNRNEVIDVLGEQVLDFIEDLFESVADQYSTMALYELGEYWHDCSWVDSDDSAEVLAKAIIGMVDSGCAEQDQYIEGQAKAVALVREFVSHA